MTLAASESAAGREGWLKRRPRKRNLLTNGRSAVWLACLLAALLGRTAMRLREGRGGDGTSRPQGARGNSPVVIRDGAAPANSDIAECTHGVVGVAANILRRQVAGRVDDQRAGELHDVGSFALGAVEGVEGFGEGAEALPEREVGGDCGGWRRWLAGRVWGWGGCVGWSGRWLWGGFGAVGC